MPDDDGGKQHIFFRKLECRFPGGSAVVSESLDILTTTEDCLQSARYFLGGTKLRTKLYSPQSQRQ